jgi:tetratricopeptide (TPR) repeat protein
VVYADLSEPRRRLMHRRVARALREHGELSEARVAELAHHATLAHDHDLAATACAAAARGCPRRVAHDEAVKLARRGLRHAEQLSGLDKVQRTIELLEIELACAQPSDPEAQQERLRALGDHALAEGAAGHARRAYYLLSVLNWERGAYRAARRDMLEAELLARGGDDAQQVLSMADAARCLLLLERDLPQAGAMLAEAEARAKRLGIESAVLCDARGILLGHQGKLDAAIEQLELAERLASTERDALLEYYALEHRAMIELDRERAEAACALAQRMVARGDKLREGSELPFARALCAIARIAGGEPLQPELELQLSALRTADAKYRLAYTLTRAALLELARGEHERALARAREARPIAELLERPSEIWLALVVMQRAAHELGERELHEEARLSLAQASWPPLAVLAERRGSAWLVEEER